MKSVALVCLLLTVAADKKAGNKPPVEPNALAMSKAVLCKEIRGYRDYDPLVEGEVTKDEKLLLYCEPTGFKTEPDKEKGFRAHLTTDGRIRRKGRKDVVFEKKNLMDYLVSAPYPPKLVYVKTMLQIKGLGPGDYELDLVLRDALDKDATIVQTVPFKVVAAKSTEAKGKESAKPKKRLP